MSTKYQVISQSPDGKQAEIVVKGRDDKGRTTSVTRHVWKRGGQWEYAKSNADGHEVVLEAYPIGGDEQ